MNGDFLQKGRGPSLFRICIQFFYSYIINNDTNLMTMLDQEHLT